MVVSEAFAQVDSPVQRLDARLRVVVALVFSIQIALSGRWPVCAAGLVLALGLVVAAKLPAGALLKRIAAVNVFVLFVVLLLPVSVLGEAAFQLGPVTFSRPGLLQAGLVALRANAIALAAFALLGTMEMVTLGHALHHLKLPDKLIHLMLLCVRYVDVLGFELLRLRQALKARGFRPRPDRHTFRTFGYLVGMLLVRSFDRSERIVAAMKCRGFRGRFHLIHHFAWRRTDLACAAAALLISAALIWGQLS